MLGRGVGSDVVLIGSVPPCVAEQTKRDCKAMLTLIPNTSTTLSKKVQVRDKLHSCHYKSVALLRVFCNLHPNFV
jgi:hypothetical protein